jgi:hypothetical protein
MIFQGRFELPIFALLVKHDLLDKHKHDALTDYATGTSSRCKNKARLQTLLIFQGRFELPIFALLVKHDLLDKHKHDALTDYATGTSSRWKNDNDCDDGRRHRQTAPHAVHHKETYPIVFKSLFVLARVIF